MTRKISSAAASSTSGGDRSGNGDGRDGAMPKAEWEMPIEHDDPELLAELRDPDHADYLFITDYLSNDLSPEDRERFEERLRTDPKFRALAEPLLAIGNLPLGLAPEPDYFDRVEAERTWQKLEARIDLERHGIHTPSMAERQARGRRLRATLFTIIGALVTGWLGIWFRPQWLPVPSAYVHVDAPHGAERSARLPDGTQVTLASGSHLSYAHWLADADEHTLNIDGEATLTIARGSRGPLTVAGPGVEVRASEARFTIHAFAAEDLADVDVLGGEVQVRPRTLIGSGEVLTLHAGERARVGPGMHIERVIRPIAADTVRTGSSVANRGVVQQSAPAKRSTPWHSAGRKRYPDDPPEFIDWPPELAARAPALADSIERDFGDRPGVMKFVGRDTMDIYFWDLSFWRNDLRPTFPEETLPFLREGGKHVAWYVLKVFGRDAGVKVVRLTFIRSKIQDRLGITRHVLAQVVSGLYTREMFEPGARVLPALSISER